MTCIICGGPIRVRSSMATTARYCSATCRNTSYKRRAAVTSIKDRFGLSTGTAGALGELQVAVDLIQKGWHVFRALSPSCPCDIMMFRNQEPPLRVEVRSATSKGDRVYHTSHAHLQKLRHQYDVLALVLSDRIIYEPPLESFSASADSLENA